jgi:hypothetical protein
MADAVTNESTVADASDSTFPQVIEVTFTFTLEMDDQIERNYWFKTGTTELTLEAIADMVDTFSSSYGTTLLSTNKLTNEQINQAMSERDS